MAMDGAVDLEHLPDAAPQQGAASRTRVSVYEGVDSTAPAAPEPTTAAGRTRDEMWALFVKYDTNHSDQLGDDELRGLLRELGITGATDESMDFDAIVSDTFMQNADKDDDGTLGFEELWSAVKKYDEAATSTKMAPSAAADAASAAQPPLFDGARFQPLAAAAVGNFVASIWEDVFDKTQESIVGGIEMTHWGSLGLDALHFGIVLLMATLLRFASASCISGAGLRALVQTCLQILAGWGAKNVLHRVSRSLQSSLVGSSSYCEAWLPPACLVVVVVVALLMTCLASMTMWLPTQAPPRRLSLRTLNLHFAALLAGSVPLPLGYAWHIACEDLFRTVTMRAFTKECDGFTANDDGTTTTNATTSTSDEYARLTPRALEWLVESAIELCYCMLLLLALAHLKRALVAHWKRSTAKLEQRSDAEKASAFRRGDRMQALGVKTCDFAVAWGLFDVIRALYAPVDSSPCYPTHGGGLAEPFAVLLRHTLVCLAVGLLRATSLRRVHERALGPLETCLRAPPVLCGGREIPAIAWGIVLNTLGIQLGWSVHGFYSGLEKRFIPSHHHYTTAIVLLCASVSTILVFAAFEIVAISSTRRGKRKLSRSPIDIVTADVAPAGVLEDALSLAPLAGIEFIPKHSGHAFQIDVVPGQTKLSTIGSLDYTFVQAHWHTPSENTIDGEHTAMEGHFVHSVASGSTVYLAVIAVLYDLSETCNEHLDEFWGAFPTDAARAGDKLAVHGLDQMMRPLLSSGYWHWTGSLTTPPCTEGVDWNMMKARLPVCQRQIEQLKGALANTQQGVDINNRATQPLYHRVVTEVPGGLLARLGALLARLGTPSVALLESVVALGLAWWSVLLWRARRAQKRKADGGADDYIRYGYVAPTPSTRDVV